MQANKSFSVAIQMLVFMTYKGEERYSSSVLADSVKTNPVVIRRQLAKLKEAQIVDSGNGPTGGFFLTKKPEDINLWEVYLATREHEFFNRPKPNPDCVVSSNLKYLVDDTFHDAEYAMQPVFENVSIADLSHRLDKILNC